MWRRRPRAKPEEIATVPLAAPEPVGQPEPFRDHRLPNRICPTHAEPPPIPHVLVLATKRRRRPLLLSLTVVVLASLLLGAGTLLAQQHIGKPTGGSSGPAHTTGQFTLPVIPTATPLPPLPNFAVIPPFCNADLQGNPLGAGTPTPTGCVTCPYVYDTTQYSIAQVEAALQAAAALYRLPPLLVEAIAWEESWWIHPGLITCDYDAGVMGLKQGYWQWMDELSDSNCGLSYTTYDPTTLQGNADMGAKFISFLYCYYGWGGGPGGSKAEPTKDTSEWYYQQRGLNWPDLTLADGQPNPNSICAAPRSDQTVHTDKDFGGTYTWAQIYAALPSDAPWSCPFSATSGDHTLYELVVAAYNAGTGTIDGQGIVNQWYIDDISTHLVNLSQGITPK
ncbi:MAG: hypothetical protein ACLQUY_22165 [Ktedonobacterales bacterium]